MEGSTTAKKSAIFLLYSFIGIFMFFVQITIGEKTTIPIDHIVTYIRSLPYFIPIYGTIIVTLGGLYPFFNKSWNKNLVTKIFSFLGLLGVLFVYMVVFDFGPAILLAPDMMPYVFNIVVVPVAAIVPVGSVFLAFLVSFGLMEFIGHFMRPIMRPLFRTPGRSAIDAVASFVGSYSLALMVTNGIFKQGKYTIKEASIIATGFSTVSATFMIIVAGALDLMPYWNHFFWITLFVTFAVTAITTRIYPLAKKPDTCYNDMEWSQEANEKVSLKRGWGHAMTALDKAPTLPNSVITNMKDGVRLAMNIAPNIMSIGVIALLLAYHSPVFDFLGYIFYPLAALLQIPDTMLFAKGVAINIADMYVPALLMVDAAFEARFLTAIICISEILFFSASIPCILSTDIPVSVKDLVIVWFERVVLSMIIAAPIIHIIF